MLAKLAARYVLAFRNGSPLKKKSPPTSYHKMVWLEGSGYFRRWWWYVQLLSWWPTEHSVSVRDITDLQRLLNYQHGQCGSVWITRKRTWFKGHKGTVGWGCTVCRTLLCGRCLWQVTIFVILKESWCDWYNILIFTLFRTDVAAAPPTSVFTLLLYEAVFS